MKKLRKIHIVIIGALVCVMVGVGLYFLVISKAIQARDAAMADRDSTVNSGGTEMNYNNMFADLQKAKLEVSKAAIQYDAVMRSKMPNLSLDDPKTGLLALWHEQAEVLGPMILNHIKSSKGIQLLTPIQIQPPPVNPNDLLGYDQSPITIGVGEIQVSGNFKSIMNHLRSWNKFRRLVVIDQPSLTGQSPNLICKYYLTVYIYPMTPPGSPVTMAPQTGNAAGAAPGAPGAPGMPPAGAMAMPPR